MKLSDCFPFQSTSKKHDSSVVHPIIEKDIFRKCKLISAEVHHTAILGIKTKQSIQIEESQTYPRIPKNY